MTDSPLTYRGSCHCGCVTFELTGRVDYAIECNCSICRARATLWHPASDENFRVLDGESELVLYQFGTKTAKHWFCRHCGIHPFARPRLDPTKWVVNVRCLEGVEPAKLPIHPFDGRNWDAAAKAFYERMRRPPAA